jgi:hypothetical protein
VLAAAAADGANGAAARRLPPLLLLLLLLLVVVVVVLVTLGAAAGALFILVQLQRVVWSNHHQTVSQQVKLAPVTWHLIEPNSIHIQQLGTGNRTNP